MKSVKSRTLSALGMVCAMVVPTLIWAQSSTDNMSVAPAPLSDMPVADFPTAPQDEAISTASEETMSELPSSTTPDVSGLTFGPGDRFQLDGFFSSGGSQSNAENSATYAIPEHGAVDLSLIHISEPTRPY